MNKKEALRKTIYEIDFALHELNLFLDTHPTNMKAMALLKEYRKKRQEAIAMYEQYFGEYINNICDVPESGCFKWLKGPWPWENDFMEDN